MVEREQSSTQPPESDGMAVVSWLVIGATIGALVTLVVLGVFG